MHACCPSVVGGMQLGGADEARALRGPLYSTSLKQAMHTACGCRAFLYCTNEYGDIDYTCSIICKYINQNYHTMANDCILNLILF